MNYQIGKSTKNRNEAKAKEAILRLKESQESQWKKEKINKITSRM